MPVHKTSKKVRQPFALIIGGTFSTTLGNQTFTNVTDPRNNRTYFISLFWESQSVAGELAAPFKIEITAGNINLLNPGDVDRKLRWATSKIDYAITSTIMRRIPYEKIIDASRAKLAEDNFFYVSNDISVVHPISRTELEKPRNQGRPFDRPDSFYQEIAQRYKEAKAQGGSIGRKPSTYIQRFFLSEIKHLSQDRRAVQIRKWVSEARKRGYIAPVERK